MWTTGLELEPEPPSGLALAGARPKWNGSTTLVAGSVADPDPVGSEPFWSDPIYLAGAEKIRLILLHLQPRRSKSYFKF